MPPEPLRLLVSVVALDEVAAALAGGADVVDVKNPAEGSLGAPLLALLKAVRAQVKAPQWLSVALGDAPHLPGTMAFAAAGAAACGADYIKLGLLGSSRREQALELLSAVHRATAETNPRTRLVAVAYADAGRVGALPARELPAIAREAGVHGVMLDTAVKDGTSTFAAMGEVEVADFLSEGRALGLMTALAGSLTLAELARARSLDVDLLGVRGAACDGGRSGTVSATRVRELKAALCLRPAASLAPVPH